MDYSLPNHVFFITTDLLDVSNIFSDVTRKSYVYRSYRKALTYIAGVKQAAAMNEYKIEKIHPSAISPTGKQQMFELRVSKKNIQGRWAIIRFPIEEFSIFGCLSDIK